MTLSTNADSDEESVGLCNLTEVLNEMTLICNFENTSASVNEPLQSYQLFLSGALLTMHYEFNLPFEGLEVVQNIVIESHKRLTSLNSVRSS